MKTVNGLATNNEMYAIEKLRLEIERINSYLKYTRNMIIYLESERKKLRKNLNKLIYKVNNRGKDENKK
jgi:hypothetical protein